MGNVLCGRVPADTCVEELRRERFRRGDGVFNHKTRRMEFSEEKHNDLLRVVSFKRKLKPTNISR